MNQYRCWAEVDLSALHRNLAWIRKSVGAGVKILSVVKADAYGHGLQQIAAALMHGGTDVFGVANLSEAGSIRRVGAGWPILMLGACLPHEIETAVRDDVRPTISSFGEARLFSVAAQRLGKTVRAHMKVDTGMGRLGIAGPDAEHLLAKVSRLKGLHVEGLYTHFASVEDNAAFSHRQQEQFRLLLKDLSQRGIHVPLVHASNSGGVLLERGSVFNMVRPGLLVYGIIPPGLRTQRIRPNPDLHPVLSWHCRVALVREIPKGTPISYGGTFVAPRRMRVAILTAGYGDGFMRSSNGRSVVLICGRRCRIVGRITMDQMIADVSQTPGVAPGDNATLIGRQGNAEITVCETAGAFGTIPWEVLTGITYRVPRVYLGAHAS
ncbi:MAG: alanine racemase [Verrucomicrobia bacterium]|nr:alanine racemase [Verrucomicrobiota bacterium]